MKMLPSARFCLVSTLALASLVPRGAGADDARATAQGLFDEAMKLMEQHAYDRACPKLKDVVEMQPRKVGALMELARCHEEWGKTALAWSYYRAAADTAAALSDPREAKARAKVGDLATRLPKLIVDVAPANRTSKGFTVQRDDHELSAAEWSTPLPADPGKHVVVASAPGKKRWSGDVMVEPRAATARVAVPELEDESGPAPPRAAPDAGARASAPVWPWIVGGLGVVSLGVATGFGIDGLKARSELYALCNGTISPCTGQTANDIAPYNSRKDSGARDVRRVRRGGRSGRGGGHRGAREPPQGGRRVRGDADGRPRVRGRGRGGQVLKRSASAAESPHSVGVGRSSWYVIAPSRTMVTTLPISSPVGPSVPVMVTLPGATLAKPALPEVSVWVALVDRALPMT